MRLWSVHPRYLDRQGLTAAWREGLLAQKVLTGTTRGYRNHPQLVRFRTDQGPGPLIVTYLHGVVAEATERGYTFDATKILGPATGLRLTVTTGQLTYEWTHLLAKLARRSPQVATRWADVGRPDPHPMFDVVPGPVADWEVLADATEPPSRWPASPHVPPRRARPGQH